MNTILRSDFLEIYGGVYEHSPWIAEAAFTAGNIDTIEKIQDAMKAAVINGSQEQQLALICAHPDLGVAPADMNKLTAESSSEQKGAGLKECTPEEFEEFQKLNLDYKQKFDFPFIIAVKGLSRQDILQEFRIRIENEEEDEFTTALEQIHKIAGFRLMALAV